MGTINGLDSQNAQPQANNGGSYNDVSMGMCEPGHVISNLKHSKSLRSDADSAMNLLPFSNKPQNPGLQFNLDE